MKPRDAENKRNNRQISQAKRSCRDATCLSGRGGWFGCGMLLQGEAFLLPSAETASQGPDTGNALLPEQQRHTGAGGLIGSSAIENDVAVARNLFLPRLQLSGVHAKRARNRERVCFEFHR